uniref:Uncharacterized protein n=1 Tax=uncultured prokaryote TaxID=198431 RepID=A0A0H5Q5J1_9ZZZZ|nr:hypothetical protein [uncultured prokaryote]
MVNTFWFNANDDGKELQITNAIVAFYQAIDAQMSNNALAENGHLIKVYDQADPEPRGPLLETTFSMTGLSGDTALPAEVALVASFQADPQSGVPQARRRGRIYVSGWGAATNAPDGRPKQTLITALNNAIASLQTDIFAIGTGTDLVLWGVYSRTSDSFAKITNGWVDNSWDTQRRRGISPTARTTWTQLP